MLRLEVENLVQSRKQLKLFRDLTVYLKSISPKYKYVFVCSENDASLNISSHQSYGQKWYAFRNLCNGGRRTMDILTWRVLQLQAVERQPFVLHRWCTTMHEKWWQSTPHICAFEHIFPNPHIRQILQVDSNALYNFIWRLDERSEFCL